MAVSISTIASQLNAMFNYATSYTATVSDPRTYTQFIADCALDADGMVIEAILANPTNGRRKSFLGTGTLAHGAAIPTRFGPIDSVVIGGVPATEAPLTEITWDRSTGLTYLPCRYAIFGNKIFHNQGSSNATIEYADYTRTSACQSPDEYYGAVLCGGAMLAASIEGDDVASASFYGQQFQGMLQTIRAGQVPQNFVNYPRAA